VKPGDVFKWENFPEPQFGPEIKSRWFIYLGHTTTLFEQPILAHICTTTTNIDDFKNGGKRFSHRYFCFQKGKYPFEQECVLDFDEAPYNYKKEDLESYKDIKICGTLDMATLRMIYEGIYSSRVYSPKIKLDIRESFGQIGLTSLKRI
jgi:hypothetical protein